MKSIISRRYRPNSTTGRWVTFDQDNKILELATIELPDRGNQHNCSCIPEGTYTINKVTDPAIVKAHGRCFQVQNVPGRSGIFIHIGNYATGVKVDTKGCILPGLYLFDLNKDGELDVAESTKAIEKLFDVLPDVSTLIII
jgi:hypothetical protein